MLSFLWYIYEIFFLIPLVPVSLSGFGVNILCTLFISRTGYKCVVFTQLLLHHSYYQREREGYFNAH